MLFSSVACPILQCQRFPFWLAQRVKADRMQLRDLLKPLNNVKTLHVSGPMNRELSDTLRTGDG